MTTIFRFAHLSILILAGLTFSASSEVRSGFWFIGYPDRDSAYMKIDFSEAESLCTKVSPGVPSCTCIVADCRADYAKITAAQGLLVDSSVLLALTPFIKNKQIRYDFDGQFYLDSILKKLQVRFPENGKMVDSVSLYDETSVFFVKTSEGRNAIMIKAGMYIGGIDRIWYYWAYQPENSAVLYKQKLHTPPSELLITPDVFSGRVNPTFRLQNAQAILAITNELYGMISPYFTFDTIGYTMKCPEILGYRSVSVAGTFIAGLEAYPTSSSLPRAEICNGKTTYYPVPLWESAIAPRSYRDRNSNFEKLVVKYGCELNLTTTDSAGTLNFCELVPDSLKTVVTGAEFFTHHWQKSTGNATPSVKVAGTRLIGSNLTGVRAATLYNLTGQRIAGIPVDGERFADHDLSFVKCGWYVVKLLNISGTSMTLQKVFIR